MFENSAHNETTIWCVSATIEIPEGHNRDENWQAHTRYVDQVFTATTAEKAARFATETFLTQWPNDVHIRDWQLAVFAPHDVDTNTGSAFFIIYSTAIPVWLMTAVAQYDKALSLSELEEAI